MKNMKLSWLAIAAAASGLVLAGGCATPPSNASAASGGEDKAVICSKCETVWVQRPHRTGKSDVTYRREKQTVCPDCQTAATAFFQSGKLESACQACGGTLARCTAQQEDVVSGLAAKSDQSVLCAKCQTVWVRRSREYGKATIYRNEQVMACPDCKSAVANFFATGKWRHTCTACGDQLSKCAASR